MSMNTLMAVLHTLTSMNTRLTATFMSMNIWQVWKHVTSMIIRVVMTMGMSERHYKIAYSIQESCREKGSFPVRGIM
jgi:hypothetical protein